MTRNDASARFGIQAEKLRYYEEQGLFDGRKAPDGSMDYCDEMMDDVAIIHLLLDAGVALPALRRYMQGLQTGAICKEQKLLFLARRRAELLNDIHSKQKTLDKLDYMIYEVRTATV